MNHAFYHVRWMIRRDMMAVLRIETECFDVPWSRDDFVRCLRQRNCIGMVTEVDGAVVGFMIYELFKDHLHLLNFAVAPDHHRCGAGRALVNNLTSKLSFDRRHRISVEVQESNLAAQLFFRSMGFVATEILRDFYTDRDEDAYQMEYDLLRLAGESITGEEERLKTGD